MIDDYDDHLSIYPDNYISLSSTSTFLGPLTSASASTSRTPTNTNSPVTVKPPRRLHIPTQILLRQRPIRQCQISTRDLNILARLHSRTLQARHIRTPRRPGQIGKRQIPQLELGRGAVPRCAGESGTLRNGDGGSPECGGFEVVEGHVGCI